MLSLIHISRCIRDSCNAGLVGTVLGIMYGAPEKWTAPLGDLLETYLRGKERLSIRELAARTAVLARQ